MPLTEVRPARKNRIPAVEVLEDHGADADLASDLGDLFVAELLLGRHL